MSLFYRATWHLNSAFYAAAKLLGRTPLPGLAGRRPSPELVIHKKLSNRSARRAAYLIGADWTDYRDTTPVCVLIRTNDRLSIAIDLAGAASARFVAEKGDFQQTLTRSGGFQKVTCLNRDGSLTFMDTLKDPHRFQELGPDERAERTAAMAKLAAVLIRFGSEEGSFKVQKPGTISIDSPIDYLATAAAAPSTQAGGNARPDWQERYFPDPPRLAR